MAGPGNSKPGPVTPAPLPDVLVPTISDYDLDKLFPAEPPPPVTNNTVPNPKTLEKTGVPEPRELTLTGAKRGDAEPYVFGRCLADPILIAADDAGDFLLMDWLWSVGECDYIEGMYVEGVNEGRADQLGKMQHFEGTSTQVASTIMAAQKGGSYDTLVNKCHSVVSWRSTWSLQVQGAIRGLKLTDPRASPQLRYSTNPAIALARILVDCGYTVNWASVATAADYCDEIVGATSPQTKRWEIGGQITGRASAREWIETLAAYASCFVDVLGGEVHLIPDEPRASNHTVTADDMIAGTVRVYRAGGRNVPDAVTVIGKSFDGASISYTYGTSGGAGTETTLHMPFFQTVDRCGRKAEEVYRKARSDMTLEFIGFDDGIQRTVGDIGTITNDKFGLSSTLMTLIENEQVARGRWRRKYVEYDATNYTDTIYTSTDNDTALDNPYLPPAGPTPTVIEETFTSYAAGWNGSYEPAQRLKVTWTGTTWPYLKDYFVTITAEDGTVAQAEYVDHIEKTGSPLAEQTHTLYSNFPLVEGEQYTIRVYRRSIVDAISETPGIAYIVASVLFYSSSQEDRGGAFNAWTDTDNALLDDGSDATYAQVVWAYDEEAESDYFLFYFSLADNGVPDGSTISNVQVRIRAWKSPNHSVVNLKGLQFLIADSSPAVLGSVKASQAVTETPTVYTFEGDLTYWGLTNAQAMQLFDDSGDGQLRFAGECVDTLSIPNPGGAQYIRVDWIKVGVTYSP